MSESGEAGGSGPPKNVKDNDLFSLKVCAAFVMNSFTQVFLHANSDIVSQHKYGEMKQI